MPMGTFDLEHVKVILGSFVELVSILACTLLNCL